MKKILFFSNNENKIKEIKNLFKSSSIEILSLKDLKYSEEPDEIGKNFAENAIIKSEFGFMKFNIPCFADDSGICVSALKNKPGVLSKRYLQNFQNKNKCLSHIVKKSKELRNNKAFFQTFISFTFGKKYNLLFEGRIDGNISNKIYGTNGFGYDPIFIPLGKSKTFAQMSTKEKNIISHRSIAAHKFLNFVTY